MADLLESGEEDFEGMQAIVMGLAHYKNSGSQDVSGAIENATFLRLQTAHRHDLERHGSSRSSAFDNVLGK